MATPNKQINEILQNRALFLQLLNTEASDTSQTVAKAAKDIAELNETISGIKVFGEKVEHEAMLQLGKRIHVPGVIKHTNEYYLDHAAYPTSYSSYSTLEQTISALERRKRELELQLGRGECNVDQLQERMVLLQVDGGEQSRIVSDRGVAVKIGDYYEIVEFED